MMVRSAAFYIQRMQKALSQMNLQLHNVVTDITGLTGMGRIVQNLKRRAQELGFELVAIQGAMTPA
jgi:phosphoglycerate dehydrogenase-like enzyme